MMGPVIETVGELFTVDRLKEARDRTLDVLITAASRMQPGMTEADAKAILSEVQNARGAPKSWHPPQLRIGENTLQPFGAPGTAGLRLKDDDIFFFDIGPIFADHEGDVGRTFAVGSDVEMIKCSSDAEAIWHAVRAHWQRFATTGADLYRFAEEQARQRGWELTLHKANGHRVADFPHVARGRGSIEGFTKTPEANRWVLEIQIRHPTRAFGAFYEDLLN